MSDFYVVYQNYEVYSISSVTPPMQSALFGTITDQASSPPTLSAVAVSALSDRKPASPWELSNSISQIELSRIYVCWSVSLGSLLSRVSPKEACTWLKIPPLAAGLRLTTNLATARLIRGPCSSHIQFAKHSKTHFRSQVIKVRKIPTLSSLGLVFSLAPVHSSESEKCAARWKHFSHHSKQEKNLYSTCGGGYHEASYF